VFCSCYVGGGLGSCHVVVHNFISDCVLVCDWYFRKDDTEFEEREKWENCMGAKSAADFVEDTDLNVGRIAYGEIVRLLFRLFV